VSFSCTEFLIGSEFFVHRVSHWLFFPSQNPSSRREVVQRSVVQENDDFTLQFMTLQRMHNHAVGDPWVGNAVNYFVDAGFRVVSASESDMVSAFSE
jgi:hypothetical protein